MKCVFAQQMEEGISNVIMQNRCGNRVTISTFDDHIGLEFVYKPNAYRRKDFQARNFSNRDNQTVLFDSFSFYELEHAFLESVEYDPFITRLKISLPNGGANEISILNVADENCFVISAKSPLTITYKPKKAAGRNKNLSIAEREGVFCQEQQERGESFVSFVAYDSYLQNRYRVLDDGTYVLQLCMQDYIVVGGEDTHEQAERVIKRITECAAGQGAGIGARHTFLEVLEENEKKIAAFTEISKLKLSEKDKTMEDVVTINRRIVYSMLDEGGVSFGAIQRIYFLIWYRDLMMSTSMFAQTGNTQLIRKSYPLCLNNPSISTTDASGNEIREYLQLMGSKWCKSEDDGLFYIVYGLFNLYRATGEDEYLWERNLLPLITAADIAIDTLFDENRGLFGSDTLGETTLAQSDFYGYDAVNGSIETYFESFGDKKAKPVYSYSLYHNTNMYNVFRMLEVLIKASADVDNELARKYGRLADSLRDSITKNFTTDINSKDEDCEAEYTYHSGLLIMDDGREVWLSDFRKHDLWEYTWAISMAMFCPDIELSMASCKFVQKAWGKSERYGFCPWNTLSRFLKEYGMSDEEYREMLAIEIHDANEYLEKYPMTGGLTEYAGNGTQWKGLPFSTGSFMYSIYALLIQSLPLGIAVRASMLAEKIENFYFKSYRIDASTVGEGEYVKSWSLNGREVCGSLQVPESMLRSGANKIVVNRGNCNGDGNRGIRLYSSNGSLLSLRESGCETELGVKHYEYEIFFPTTGEMVFEGFDKMRESNMFTITASDGSAINHSAKQIANSDYTIVNLLMTEAQKELDGLVIVGV